MQDPKDIEFLTDRKFPLLRALVRRQNAHHQGRPKQVDAYLADLAKMPADEFAGLVREERAKQAQEWAEKAEREERERFFNQPHAQAYFEHWSRASYWTLEEATALSFGKAPERVTVKSVTPYALVSPFATAFMQRLELAKRALWAQQLYEPVYPTVYLAWARRMEINVDTRLVAAIEARGLQIADWKTLYDQLRAQYDELAAARASERTAIAELNERQVAEILRLQELLSIPEPPGTAETKERESLLKLVIGMAVAGYRYDPVAKRNSVVPEIVSDLERLGVRLTDDTVRKYLREAAELLPAANTLGD